MSATVTRTYRGERRDGMHVIGSTRANLESFVRAKFKAGWRTLDVHDEADNCVGCIQRQRDTGARIWWVSSGPDVSM